MRKTYKIIFLLLIIMFIFSMVTNVKALDFWEVAKNWIDTGMEGKSEQYLTTTEGMNNIAKKNFQELIDFLWSIGLLTIFISTIILGIKYMLVSPNEKSKIKQAVTPYVVGVVIIFGAVTIWKFIIEVLGSL